jgi:hypothetical protein
MHSQIARETPAPWKSHPELGTGIEQFGYSGFKRKFLFFNLDIPSMPNTASQRVFRCAAKKQPKFPSAGKIWRFKGLRLVLRPAYVGILHRNKRLKLFCQP